MDPVVKSIEDAKKGIHNPDSWNNEMPLSEADITRRTNIKILFGVFTIVLTGLTLLMF
jgi:hypothetical protein